MRRIWAERVQKIKQQAAKREYPSEKGITKNGKATL